MMKVQEKLEKSALAVMRIATTTSTRNISWYSTLGRRRANAIRCDSPDIDLFGYAGS